MTPTVLIGLVLIACGAHRLNSFASSILIGTDWIGWALVGLGVPIFLGGLGASDSKPE